jgi:hypothetical protein
MAIINEIEEDKRRQEQAVLVGVNQFQGILDVR